jgi:N utilization substance protein A
MVKELKGEKIDVIRWSDSLETFIRNALAPIHVEHLAMDASTKIVKAYARAENLATAGVPTDLKCQLISELLGWKVHIAEI